MDTSNYSSLNRLWAHQATQALASQADPLPYQEEPPHVFTVLPAVRPTDCLRMCYSRNIFQVRCVDQIGDTSSHRNRLHLHQSARTSTGYGHIKPREPRCCRELPVESVAGPTSGPRRKNIAKSIFEARCLDQLEWNRLQTHQATQPFTDTSSYSSLGVAGTLRPSLLQGQPAGYDGKISPNPSGLLLPYP